MTQGSSQLSDFSMARRRWLRQATMTPLATWLGGACCLSACGGAATNSDGMSSSTDTNGTSNNTQVQKVTAVSYSGMAVPNTDDERAWAWSNASATLAYSNGSTRTVALSYRAITRTGASLPRPQGGAAALVGGYYDVTGQAIIDSSTGSSLAMYSDCPDGVSLLKLPNTSVAAGTGNTLFLAVQFEYKTANASQGEARPSTSANALYARLPAQLGVLTLDQDLSNGNLSARFYHPVDAAAAHGLWSTCAASLSPWNTHLSSEEYPPDATTAASNTQLAAFSASYFGNADVANPYHYGHVPELTVNPDGTASLKKHFNLGRLSREKVLVMPDNKTVLMGNDANCGGIYLFIADRANDLSAGRLYAAKLTETNASARASGGAFRIDFIALGHATSSQIEQLAARLFSAGGREGAWRGILQATHRDYKLSASGAYTQAMLTANQVTIYVKSLDAGIDFSQYYLINDGNGQQLVRFADGVATEGSDAQLGAAFLETPRYAAMKGATLELSKFEGVALNVRDKVAYFAISSITDAMLDNDGTSTVYAPSARANVLKLPRLNAGAVYEVQLGSNAAMGSDWVPASMSVPSALLGQDIASDLVGNTAAPDAIANPDNLAFSEGARVLYIGEDSGAHVNNVVWAYHVDSRKLVRIMSMPAGAECTGLQAVDNLNGFAYVMSSFQHPGDWTSVHTTLLNRSGSTLNAAVNQLWSNKNQAAIGYLQGLPGLT